MTHTTLLRRGPAHGRGARNARTLALAVLLAAPLLAGCLTSAITAEGITGKQAEARGLDDARAWQADAVVLGLAGAEARVVPESEGVPDHFDLPFAIPTDPNPGDGRAPFWFLVFASAEAHCLLFLMLASTGSHQVEQCLPEEARDESDEIPSFGSWTVDTPTVADRMRENATVMEILAQEDAVYASTLGDADPDEPLAWEARAASEVLGVVAEGVVDANTGALMDFEVRPFARGPSSTVPGAGGPVEHTFDGTVSAASPEASHGFQVPAGYTEIHVARFATDPTLPGDDATLTLLGPDGEELAGDGDTYPVTMSGTHTATVRYTSDRPSVPVPGFGVDYELELHVMP